MKNRPGEKIKLASLDELLGVVNEESAMEIEINKIHAFKNHPFKVLDDEKMQDLIESVKLTVFANRKAWWKCKDCGREWNTLISTRSGGSKCPYCSGYIFSKGFNDLQTTHPEIQKSWLLSQEVPMRI